jgi:hypothetical protein
MCGIGWQDGLDLIRDGLSMNPVDWFVAGFAGWKLITFRKFHGIGMTAARCPVKSLRVALISRHHCDAMHVIFYKFKITGS